MIHIDWKQSNPAEDGTTNKRAEANKYADEIYGRIRALAIAWCFYPQDNGNRGLYQVEFSGLTQDEKRRQYIIDRLNKRGPEDGLRFVKLDVETGKCTYRLVEVSQLPPPPDES